MTSSRWMRLSGAALFGLLLWACPGSFDDPERFRIKRTLPEAASPMDQCAEVTRTLFAQKCAGNVCHGQASDLALDLESPGTPERLVGVAGTNDCAGEPIIDPANPERSLLYQKLTPTPPCGDPMPYGSAPGTITEQQLSCMLHWISQAGAGPDGGAGSDAGDASTPPEDSGPIPEAGDARPETGDATPDVERDAPTTGPIDPRSWTVSASMSAPGDTPQEAIDGMAATRWSTGQAQAGGEWFQIDLGTEETFSTIVLDASGSAMDYPRGYAVHLTSDLQNLGAPVASGAGSAVTTITFTPARARYVRVVQTGMTDPSWWSIHELRIER